MSSAPSTLRGLLSSFMLKSPQGSPQVHISPLDVSTQECMPPAAHWMTLSLGTHLTGALMSLCTEDTPHWPYSFPPQAYVWPSSAAARQCQPPIVTWQILVDPKADTLRGFRTISCLCTMQDFISALVKNWAKDTGRLLVALSEYTMSSERNQDLICSWCALKSLQVLLSQQA